MTVVVEINGQNIEFPDMETAQAYAQSLQGGEQPAAETSEIGDVGGMSAAATDGLLFGAGDEYLAGLSALLGVQPDGAGGANWFDYDGGFIGGMGDRYGVALDQIREEQGQYSAEHPGRAIGAEIGGALAGALVPVGSLAALRSASLPTRVGASAAAGGAGAGVYGFNEGEGGFGPRLESGADAAPIGAAIGAAMPIAGAGLNAALNRYTQGRAVRQAASGAPSSEELRAMGNAAYRQIDEAGVAVRPDAVGRSLDDIIEALRAEGAGYRGAETVLPGSRAVMSAAEDIAGGLDNRGAVPFSELDMFRRYVGNASASNPANRADTRATSMVIGQLDDMVDNLTPSNIASNNPADLETLQEVLPRARDIWARMSRSQLLDDAIENSENYLSGGASGIRNQFARILRSPQLSRGFTDAERQVMRRVAQGSLPEQIVYLAASGMGNIASVGAGAALGGLTGGLAGVGASAGLRRVAEALARRNAETARAVVANGGLAQLPVANPAFRDITEALGRRSGAVGAN